MSQLLAYAGLLSAATGCVYVGSYASLHTPMKTRELRKAAGLNVNEDEEEGKSQSLTSENAYFFPVLGSIVLFSLYLAFKYLDKQMVNLLLSLYFVFAGAYAIPAVVEHLVRVACGGKNVSLDALLLRVRLPKPSFLQKPAPSITNATKPPMPQQALTVDLLGYVIMGLYLYSRYWPLTNLVALCLAVQGMMLITLDAFTTGFILLGGLFFYDIFWVFGSARLVRSGPSVMVSVATNFDGPIKLLCPKNLLEVAHAWYTGGAPTSFAFALLGLGDIVIPGVFVALALRFDQMHASEKHPGLHFTRFFFQFPKPYFTASLAAYVGGLVTTMGVMHVFGAAQPALLYLSPACALSVVIVARQRQELSLLWHWVDRTPEPSPVEAKTA